MHYYGYVLAYKDKDGFEHPVKIDSYDGERCIVFTNKDSAEKHRVRFLSRLTDKLGQGEYVKSEITGMLWWKDVNHIYRPLTAQERSDIEVKIKNVYVAKVKLA